MIKKIPLLIMAFFDPFVLRATLHGLNRLKNRIAVTVVENSSLYSHLIRSVITPFVRNGLVERHYLFHDNISGNAMLTVLREKIDLGEHDLIMISDGDLIAYNRDWLEECMGILNRHEDVLSIGARLDRKNLPLQNFSEAVKWDSPFKIIHEHYVEGINGCAFWLFRSPELQRIINYLDREQLEFRDTVLFNYCYHILRKRWGMTKHSVFRHLSWDSYADLTHPYTVYKMSKSFAEHWEHRRSSAYTAVCDINDPIYDAGRKEPWPRTTSRDRFNMAKWWTINTLVRAGGEVLLGGMPAVWR